MREARALWRMSRLLRPWICVLAVAIVAGSARQASAQGFISPFLGYNFSGDSGCPQITNCEDKHANFGVAFGHSLLGYAAASRGLDRLEVDSARLAEDLAANWDVLAEAVQTVMRRYGLPDPYEQLKQLTRGKRVDGAAMREFIRTLALPEREKDRLLELTPANYVGLAPELARKI